MVTISDVAKRAEVSPAVVSRVLNEDPSLRIGVETRARVLSAVEELNYVPRHAARSLRMHLPSVLSLVLPDATSAVHAQLIGGVESAAHQRNLVINVLRAEHIVSAPDWLPRFVREGRTDGLMLQVPDLAEEGVFSALSGLGVPLVLLNSIDSGPLSTIVYDDRAGVRAGVETFVELGHRRVGYVGGPLASRSAVRRKAAFEEIARDRALEVRPEWKTDLGFTTEDGRRAAAVLLAARDRPTAIFIANVNCAMGFIAEAHRMGADLPGDASLIALHEVPYAEATWPPLSTVEMPNAAMGSAAVEMLFESGAGVRHVVVTDPAPRVHLRASAVAAG
jgi:DNA-binding LacI/PurR family transcriptional regulator